ncbi:hypothetical protein M8445_18290 (plasmid) [Deinococcus aquaticus]|uniref:CopG family transcriptional regulator n=1 Tax=Deinococcus aquaticus TaxID=328692 RepID=A0ABY7V8J7_9DEIO|nr:hypothetical protein [Deinococcus aquaticus]WDA60818.1 hypothetical protein M8445_18290 [Deinococcus aquaticus]
MTEKSNRLTLYVPHGLAEAISAEAERGGLSLSELTRYLYARHLMSVRDGKDTGSATPPVNSEAAFFEELGRKFYALSLGAVTAHGQLKTEPVTKKARGRKTPV